MSHAWIKIVLGRACTECSIVQMNGEFDDMPGCKRDKPYEPKDERETPTRKR